MLYGDGSCGRRWGGMSYISSSLHLTMGGRTIGVSLSLQRGRRKLSRSIGEGVLQQRSRLVPLLDSASPVNDASRPCVGGGELSFHYLHPTLTSRCRFTCQDPSSILHNPSLELYELYTTPMAPSIFSFLGASAAAALAMQSHARSAAWRYSKGV